MSDHHEPFDALDETTRDTHRALASPKEDHTTREVHLFVTESFTFQVLDRTAFVPFQLGAEPRRG